MRLQRHAGLVVAVLMLPVAAEAGRCKVGNGGCYWEPNDSGPNQCSCTSTTTGFRYKKNGYGGCYLAPESGSNECSPPSMTSDLANRYSATAGAWKQGAIFSVTGSDALGRPTKVSAPASGLPPATSYAWQKGLPNLTVTADRVYLLSQKDREAREWRSKQAMSGLPMLFRAQTSGWSCTEKASFIHDLDLTLVMFGSFQTGFFGSWYLGQSFGWNVTALNALRAAQLAAAAHIVILQAWRYNISGMPCWTGGPSWIAHPKVL